MITINEHNNVAERNFHAGLLTDRVDRDLSNTLAEFGTEDVDHPRNEAVEAPRISFGYGIPMAGVRYYSFHSEG